MSKVDSFIQRMERFKGVYAAFAVLAIPFSVGANAISWMQSKQKVASLLAAFSNGYFIWLLCSAVLLFGISLFLMPAKKGKQIIEGLWPQQQPAPVTSRKKYISIILIAAIVNFVCAIIFYLRNQHTSLDDSGILGVQYENKEFNDLLEQLIQADITEADYKLVNDQRAKNDAVYRRKLFFQNFRNKGLVYYGSFVKQDKLISVLCKLEWYGDYDSVCLDRNKIAEQSERPLLLREYSLDIDANSRIVATFILGYYYLHSCKTARQASSYFEDLLRDSSLLGSLNRNPQNKKLQKFIADVSMFRDISTRSANRPELRPHVGIVSGNDSFPASKRCTTFVVNPPCPPNITVSLVKPLASESNIFNKWIMMLNRGDIETVMKSYQRFDQIMSLGSLPYRGIDKWSIAKDFEKKDSWLLLFNAGSYSQDTLDRTLLFIRRQTSNSSSSGEWANAKVVFYDSLKYIKTYGEIYKPR